MTVTIWALLGLALLAGVATRFVGLQANVYWRDEVATSLRNDGLTTADVVQAFGREREVRPSEIRDLLFPPEPAPLSRVLGSILREEPHRTPLYYVLVWMHASMFGTSVLSLRLLSLVGGLLVLPAGYWLCRELFADRAVAVICVALLATSPFHILYAQEAREYSLWTAIVLASSAALLRALRLMSPGSWLLYTLLASLGLLIAMLQLLVFTSHGLYVLWRWSDARRTSGRIRQLPPFVFAFAASMLVAGLALAPWIWSGLEYRAAAASATDWQSNTLPPAIMLREWLRAFSRPFVGFAGEQWLYSLVPRGVGYALSVAALTLVGWALWALWRQPGSRQRDAARFVTLLLLVNLLVMVVPDLLFGGIRSVVGRYMVPAWLGFGLAVAALMASGCRTPGRAGQLWTGGLVVLVVMSGTSSFALAAHPGAGKLLLGTSGSEALEAIELLVASPTPYVLVERMDQSDIRPGDTMAVGIRAPDHVRFIVSSDPATVVKLSGQGEVFVLQPSDEQKRMLESVGTLEDVVQSVQLYRLRAP